MKSKPILPELDTYEWMKAFELAGPTDDTWQDAKPVARHVHNLWGVGRCQFTRRDVAVIACTYESKQGEYKSGLFLLRNGIWALIEAHATHYWENGVEGVAVVGGDIDEVLSSQSNKVLTLSPTEKLALAGAHRSPRCT